VKLGFLASKDDAPKQQLLNVESLMVRLGLLEKMPGQPVDDVLLVMQRQVSAIWTLHRTVEVLQVQCVNRTVDVFVVHQRQVLTNQGPDSVGEDS